MGIRQPGEFIGEIGLLNQDAPRTATARVLQAASLLTLTYAEFDNLLKRYPELTDVAAPISLLVLQDLPKLFVYTLGI